MGLFIGVMAVILMLVLIFAMALAEWADKDLGELFSPLFKRKVSPAPDLAARDSSPGIQAKAAARTKKAVVKTGTVKKGSVTGKKSGPLQPKRVQSKAKAKTVKTATAKKIK